MPAAASLTAQQAIQAELTRRKTLNERKIWDKRPVTLSSADEQFFVRYCGAHEKQLKFILDTSKLIALQCCRRVGKTSGSLGKVLRTARRFPGSAIAYVVPTSVEHAKRLFWRPLEDLDRTLHLGMKFIIGEDRVLTPEGTSIHVFGARNKESPMQLRGNAWSLGILDECKDFGAHFEALITEALMPALEDYNASLCLLGTPGETQAGLFYDVTGSEKALKGWSRHFWEKKDNPHLPPEARDLDRIEREEYLPFGLTRHSAKFKREQLGIWATDANERAYSFTRECNGWDADERTGTRALPPGHDWYYTLGLDLGEKDKNAFTVAAFSPTCTDMYFVYEYAREAMSIDEIADKTRMLMELFSPMVCMVADTGGYGRGITTDLSTRHNLAFEPADKRGNKLGNVAQMNSDFLTGRIKADPDCLLAEEWLRLSRRMRPDGIIKIDHSDLGDSALYAWKASKHYASREKVVEPVAESREYYEQQDLKEAQAYADRIRGRGSDGELFGRCISSRPEWFY